MHRVVARTAIGGNTGTGSTVPPECLHATLTDLTYSPYGWSPLTSPHLRPIGTAEAGGPFCPWPRRQHRSMLALHLCCGLEESVPWSAAPSSLAAGVSACMTTV